MNMQQMMQQAQKMQSRLQDMQSELENMEVQGQSGGGMIKVTMTCKGMIKNLDIDPEAVDPKDVETLEDLILAACNDARTKADERLAEETQKIMQELGLPQGMGGGLPGMLG